MKLVPISIYIHTAYAFIRILSFLQVAHKPLVPCGVWLDPLKRQLFIAIHRR